jgi:CRP-like cAMP-binding protein
MKFAAHDRGTARTLIRTAPSHGAYELNRPVAADRHVDGRTYAVTINAAKQNGRQGYSQQGPVIPGSRGVTPQDQLRPARGVSFTYLRGQRIIGPEEGAGLVYIVRAGCVRLYKILPDGRAINLGLLGPTTLFTQEDRADGLASGVIAEALVETTLTVIEQGELSAMIAQTPELAAALVEGMGRRLTSVQLLVEQLLARDVTVRLATILLSLAERFGRPLPEGLVKIALPVPHQLLANMIGSNRVTVTRKLSDLRTQGVARALGRNLLAVDPEQLRAYIQAASRPEGAMAMATDGDD